MVKLEVPLTPDAEWNEHGLEDWYEALNGLLAEKGWTTRAALQIPGYQVIEFASMDGKAKAGDLILSEGERAVVVLGLSLHDDWKQDFIRFMLQFACGIGAQALLTYAENYQLDFWRDLGAKFLPDPEPFPSPVESALVSVTLLPGMSLLVTYQGHPVLCLEPIACNVHAQGVISLAQRRIERHFGGVPLGFASRVATRCPWDIPREVWDELLACSRLQAYEIIAQIIIPSSEGKIV